MLSKKNEQFIRSLSLRKFRQKYNNFIIEGDKMVRELLDYSNAKVEQILATEQWISKNQNQLSNVSYPVITVTDKELKKVSTLKTPNQVLAVVQYIQHDFHSSMLQNKLTLYLDNIQNPGNLGTILRTADWFGIEWVICSTDTVDSLSPKAVQATMGALFSVKTIRKDLTDLEIKNLNLPIYGAILEGDDIFKTKLQPNGIIIIGNEGQGIRPEIREHIDYPISIPAHQNTRIESLNAAIATSIICAAFTNNQFFTNT